MNKARHSVGRGKAWALLAVSVASFMAMAIVGVFIVLTAGVAAIFAPMLLLLELACAALGGWWLKTGRVEPESRTLVKVAFVVSGFVCAIFCVSLALSVFSIGLGGILGLVLKYTVPS